MSLTRCFGLIIASGVLGCRPETAAVHSPPAAGSGRGSSSATAQGHRRIELDEGAAAAVDLEGERLVTLSREGTLRLWDLRTGALLETWSRPLDASRPDTLATGTSPNGRWLGVALRTDEDAQLVDLRSGTVETVPGSESILAISNDGTRMVRAREDRAQIVERSSGRVIASLRANDRYRGAVFSDDGARVYIVDAGGVGTLRSVQDGAELGAPGPWWPALELRPPTMPARVVSAGKPCVVWDTKTGRKIRELGPRENCRATLPQQPKSRVVLQYFTAESTRFEVWELDGERPLWSKTVPSRPRSYTDMRLDASGRWIVATGMKSAVWSVDNETAPPWTLPKGLRIELSPDARRAAISGFGETLVVRRDGTIEGRSKANGQPLFLADGSRMVVVDDSTRAMSELWSVGKKTRPVRALGGYAETGNVQVRRDGAVLLTEHARGHGFYSLETGDLLRTCPAERLVEHAWLDDSSVIRVTWIEGAEGVEFSAFDVDTCRPKSIALPTIPDETTAVERLLYARPGQAGVAIALGGTSDAMVFSDRPPLRLEDDNLGQHAWNTTGTHLIRYASPAPFVTSAAGRQMGQLGTHNLHDQESEVLALGPDASTAAGYDRGTIRLFDVVSGKVTAAYELSDFIPKAERTIWTPNEVASLAFSPDGALLAVRSPFGQFAVIDVATGNAVGEVTENASAFAWGPGVDELAVATYVSNASQQEVLVYKGRGLRRVATLTTHRQRVGQLEYAGSKLLVVGERLIDVIERG